MSTHKKVMEWKRIRLGYVDNTRQADLQQKIFKNMNNFFLFEGILDYMKMLVYIHTCQISHYETKSHRIWPIWKAIPIKNSNLTEFSDHFTTDIMKK